MNMEGNVEFIKLAHLANQAMEEKYCISQIGQFVRPMIKLAKRDTDNRKLYVEAIAHIWDQGIDIHIVEFCCHVLRWKELEMYFIDKSTIAKKQNDIRAWQCLDSILDTFDDEWRDNEYKDIVLKEA
jgi:hypothetical protein